MGQGYRLWPRNRFSDTWCCNQLTAQAHICVLSAVESRRRSRARVACEAGVSAPAGSLPVAARREGAHVRSRLHTGSGARPAPATREDLLAGAGGRRPHSVLLRWGPWDRVSYPFPKHREVRIAVQGAARLHPAGRCWAATTTEGLLIYSLDAQLLFDPFELDTSVTPGRVRAALRQRDFTRAVLMAFRLNERELLQEALESVPWDESERRAGPGLPAGAELAWIWVLCSEPGSLPFPQLKLSAPPSLSYMWRKCLSFWPRPLKCLAI